MIIHEINKELEDFNGPDVQVNRRMVYYDIDFMQSDQGYSIPLKKLKMEERFISNIQNQISQSITKKLLIELRVRFKTL